MKLFGKRRKIQFTDKTHPVLGIVSLAIGGVCLIIMLALFIGAGKAKGNAALWYGYLGTIDMFAAIVGLFLAIKCFKKEDVYYTTPAIGAIINGILTAIFICLLFVGVL